MSHTTEIKGVTISDITALRSAIKELNENGCKIELQENVKPRAYSVNQAGMGVAPYVLYLKDAKYDVGLYPDGKGGYVARTDFWGGSVQNVLGVPGLASDQYPQGHLGKLYQSYAIHAVTRQAVQRGQSVRRIPQDNGTVKLVVTINN